MVEVSAKPRDPWFDNAKMGLVTLVVVGHAWRFLPYNGTHGHLFDFLYAWHIPAFVFVTGYLSRSFTWRADRLWQLVRMTVVPYLIFEALYGLFRIHLGGEVLERMVLNPHWPMWYLAALFFWRLATPLFRALPAPLAVSLAVLISLLGGFWAPETFDLARVLGFLPFFVLGLQATPDRLELLRTRRASWAAVGVFVVIAALTWWTERLASSAWLLYRSPYAELEASDLRAVATRAVLLVIGTLGAWAFLALVPRRHGWFTAMGAWTMVVYLCHGFFIRGIDYLGYDAWARDHVVISPLVTTAYGVAVALLLAAEPVARRLNHLVDPAGYAEQSVRDAQALHRALRELDTADQDAGAAAAEQPGPTR